MKLFLLFLVSLSLATAISIPSHARLTRRTLRLYHSAPASIPSVSKLTGTTAELPSGSEIIPGLENYEIIEELGEGSFSVVFLAQHRWKIPKSLVALKICPINRLETASKEVEILKRISPHRNIIQLIESTRTNIHFTIVLEYIPFGNLFDLINNHHEILVTDDLRLVKQIFKQILEAVLHIHNEGVVHRDLKPENILVCFDPENPPTNDDSALVKLTDFDISHDVGLSPIPATGSPAYLSPEIIMNNLSDVDPRKIDVWALGVVLFALIECRLPFDGFSRIELFYKTNIGINSFGNKVPGPAIALVLKMLTGDWKKRAGLQEIVQDDWLNN